MKKIIAMSFLSLFLVSTLAEDKKPLSEVQKSKVKYKAASRIDFESLLIEGERKKPEMAVVTGNLGEKDSGLLKFRKDFLDVMADDFGEAVK
ncbi:MAG: hypothetical protein NXH75_03360 [Halobacteriovoraceae bacterium]|nr:hypothetical protein [Halobacteriovoraceae bacterium]